MYVASYLAPNGHYAGDTGYFAGTGVDNPPLHALQDGVSGANGVYIYGSGGAFPSFTWQSANYWVDVVFVPDLSPDTTPPTVTGTSPVNNAVDVPRSTAVSATFSEAMDPATISNATFELRDAGGALVPLAVTYEPRYQNGHADAYVAAVAERAVQRDRKG